MSVVPDFDYPYILDLSYTETAKNLFLAGKISLYMASS